MGFRLRVSTPAMLDDTLDLVTEKEHKFQGHICAGDGWC